MNKTELLLQRLDDIGQSLKVAVSRRCGLSPAEPLKAAGSKEHEF